MTKLWILGRSEYADDTLSSDPKNPFRSIYDCYSGFIIEAETELRARRIASESAGDEGEDTWLSSKWTYCRELVLDGKEGIWMSDFHAG